jgi:hypothetical protein
LNAAGDDLEEVLRIGMSVANVAAVKSNDRLSFRYPFRLSRAALGVSGPGPCKLALDLLLVEALADSVKAIPYGLGIPSIFDGKDLAQEVGNLLEGKETRALGLEVEPFRSDEAMAEAVAELREGPLGRVETGADNKPPHAERDIAERRAEDSSIVSPGPEPALAAVASGKLGALLDLGGHDETLKGCRDLLSFLEGEAKFVELQVATTLDGGDRLFVILSPVSVGHDLDDASHAPLPGHLRRSKMTGLAEGRASPARLRGWQGQPATPFLMVSLTPLLLARGSNRGPRGAHRAVEDGRAGGNAALTMDDGHQIVITHWFREER